MHAVGCYVSIAFAVSLRPNNCVIKESYVDVAVYTESRVSPRKCAVVLLPQVAEVLAPRHKQTGVRVSQTVNVLRYRKQISTTMVPRVCTSVPRACMHDIRNTSMFYVAGR